MYLRERLPEFDAPTVRQKPYTADLAGLIAWLETQDGAMKYDATDSQGCPFTRFAAAAGISARGTYPALPGAIPDARWLWHAVATPHPQTYKAALRRAKRVTFWRRVRAFFKPE